MAKLYINKDIAADADKMKYWLSGNDCVSFSDIQGFLDWMLIEDNKIEVELHSCGGNCTEGYAIYDALRASGKEISCKAVGVCASMATVIMLAAPIERRSAYQHAEFLIHSPFYGSCAGIGELTIEKLDELKTSLQADKEKMLAVYMDRTGQSREVLEAQMETNGWFNAEKAIELGFISSIVLASSASVEKIDIKSNPKKSMTKEKKATVAQAFRMLGVALGVVEETPKPVSMVITTSTGDELTVEREEGEIQVGDPASPDGEFVLEDGRTVVVVDGVITEIKDPEENTDTSDLEARIAELEAENAELRSNAKSETETQILAAVTKAGGENWLRKATGSYTPPTRSTSPQAGKREETQPVSKIDKKLADAREKQKNRFKR